MMTNSIYFETSNLNGTVVVNFAREKEGYGSIINN